MKSEPIFLSRLSRLSRKPLFPNIFSSGKSFLCLASVCLFACTNKTTDNTPGPSVQDAQVSDAAPVDKSPAEWNRKVTPPSDEEALTKRQACAYAKGALPEETLGVSAPKASEIPIEHIVLIMMENRSFDHYFQKAKSKGIDVDVAPDNFSNLDSKGNSVAIHRDDVLCHEDTNHGWNGSHTQFNQGKMDGFVLTNETVKHPANATAPMIEGGRAMTYYEEDQIPLMYWAARNFAIGDKYFCSLLGPTWPNRMFYYAGSSFGITSNHFPPKVDATIYDHLETRGISWRLYAEDVPGLALFPERFLKYQDDHHSKMAQFFDDAKNGKLPQVSYLDPNFSRGGVTATWEHPPSIMQFGQNWLARVIQALMTSPQWSKTALFVVYDEHGGYYDHVPPPKTCTPDDLPPENGKEGEAFDRLGFRVPFLVISPYAKKGFVSHRTYDHTSILRMIETKFKLPALSRRDANAEAPWDMFDFKSPPDLSRTTQAPVVSIPPEKVDTCAKVFGIVDAGQ